MEKVKISKDGSAIDFVQSDKVPVSPKKFRQGPELEGFYRFVFENDLRKEALQVIDRIYLARKAMKMKKPLEALKKAKNVAQEALKSAIVSAPKKIQGKNVKAPAKDASTATKKAKTPKVKNVAKVAKTSKKAVKPSKAKAASKAKSKASSKKSKKK